MENKWLRLGDNCRWAHALTPFLVCMGHSIKVFEGYANNYENMLSRFGLSRMTSLKESERQATSAADSRSDVGAEAIAVACMPWFSLVRPRDV